MHDASFTDESSVFQDIPTSPDVVITAVEYFCKAENIGFIGTYKGKGNGSCSFWLPSNDTSTRSI